MWPVSMSPRAFAYSSIEWLVAL